MKSILVKNKVFPHFHVGFDAEQTQCSFKLESLLTYHNGHVYSDFSTRTRVSRFTNPLLALRSLTNFKSATTTRGFLPCLYSSLGSSSSSPSSWGSILVSRLFKPSIICLGFFVIDASLSLSVLVVNVGIVTDTTRH